MDNYSATLIGIGLSVLVSIGGLIVMFINSRRARIKYKTDADKVVSEARAAAEAAELRATERNNEVKRQIEEQQQRLMLEQQTILTKITASVIEKEDQIRDLNDRLLKAVVETGELRMMAGNLKLTLEQLGEKNEALAATINTQKSEIAANKDKIEAQDEEIASLRKQIDQQRVDYEDKIKVLESQRIDLVKRLEDTDRQAKEIQKRLDEAMLDNDKLRQEIADANKRFDRIQSENKRLADEKVTLEEKIAKMSTQIADVKREVDTFIPSSGRTTPASQPSSGT